MPLFKVDCPWASWRAIWLCWTPRRQYLVDWRSHGSFWHWLPLYNLCSIRWTLSDFLRLNVHLAPSTSVSWQWRQIPKIPRLFYQTFPVSSVALSCICWHFLGGWPFYDHCSPPAPWGKDSGVKRSEFYEARDSWIQNWRQPFSIDYIRVYQQETPWLHKYQIFSKQIIQALRLIFIVQWKNCSVLWINQSTRMFNFLMSTAYVK